MQSLPERLYTLVELRDYPKPRLTDEGFHKEFFEINIHRIKRNKFQAVKIAKITTLVRDAGGAGFQPLSDDDNSESDED